MTAEDKIIADKGEDIAEEFIRQFVNPNFKMSQIPSDKLKKIDEAIEKDLESYNKLLDTGIAQLMLKM